MLPTQGFVPGIPLFCCIYAQICESVHIYVYNAFACTYICTYNACFFLCLLITDLDNTVWPPALTGVLMFDCRNEKITNKVKVSVPTL